MLELLEAPADFITLAEAKKHLEVSHARDDALIASQIKAAIGYLDGPDGYLGAAIALQRWRYRTCSFGSPLRMPLGPVISVQSVSYRNTNDATVVLGAETYFPFKDASGPILLPVESWPSDVHSREDAVTIDFTAGRTSIPPQLKSAALLIVGQLYQHREIDVDVRLFPTTFSMFHLAHPYRMSL